MDMFALQNLRIARWTGQHDVLHDVLFFRSRGPILAALIETKSPDPLPRAQLDAVE